MSTLIFAANWKMHQGPTDAGAFLHRYLQRHRRAAGREVWFFPPAVSLTTVAAAVADRGDIVVGAQNVYWEEQGAFTGEISPSMVRDAGARAALVGHSERRHVFGETDEETGRKVRALLAAGLIPMLCVGETLDQREAGETMTVVERQLSVLEGLDGGTLEGVPIAYEPVWAIGTGRTATPEDAGTVHRGIRAWLGGQGAGRDRVRVVYGGSVKPGNVEALLATEGVDGVLVGGASLHPESWAAISSAGLD